MKLNPRQVRAIQATEPRILCAAAPASGKTTVITQRINHLIQNGADPSKIVAITFTRMAADEMKKRLGSIIETSFIGTVHSYANDICVMNNVDTSQDIIHEHFDNILQKAQKIPNTRYPKVEHLLIDEVQDLTQLEYDFIKRIPAKNIFLCGDDRQNIYQFRGGSDKYLADIAKDEEYKKYFLIDNYRNAPNILSFANGLINSFHSISPYSKAVKHDDGIVERVDFYEALCDLKDVQDWGSWFILARTNSDLLEVQRILEDEEIPNLYFKKGDFDKSDQLVEVLRQDAVKLLTIHSAKGLENQNVIVCGGLTYSEEERKISYVAATRAKQSLYWCPALTSARKNKTKVEKTNSGIVIPMIDFG